MDSKDFDYLIDEAIRVRRNAYVPYSGYSVGAAVLTENGNIYKGCNVENQSYGLTICAERNAVFSAVAAGERHIKAIAIVGSFRGEEITDYAYPCGACRQVIAEFSDSDTVVIVAKSIDDYKKFTIAELLPECFTFLS
jgi:cytidine deaminase (EC 3.5.4.5)